MNKQEHETEVHVTHPYQNKGSLANIAASLPQTLRWVCGKLFSSNLYHANEIVANFYHANEVCDNIAANFGGGVSNCGKPHLHGKNLFWLGNPEDELNLQTVKISRISIGMVTMNSLDKDKSYQNSFEPIH